MEKDLEFQIHMIEEAKPGETAAYSGTPSGVMEPKYQKDIEEGKTSIMDYIIERATKHPEKIAILEKEKEGIYKQITYEQLIDDTRALARAILQNNMAPEIVVDGMKLRFIGAFLTNRHEALLADFACMMIGAITVTLFEEPVDHLEYLLNEGHYDTMLIENKYVPNLLNKMENKSLRIITNFILVEDLGSELRERAKKLGINLYSYSELLKQGRSLTLSFPRLSFDNVFALVVTSGSTGMPKAAITRNSTMLVFMKGYWGTFFDENDSICCNINYGFGSVKFSVYTTLALGGHIVFFGNSFEKTFDVMRETNPTWALFPPILLHKAYPGILSKIEQMPPEKRDMIKMMIKKKIEYMKAEKKVYHPEIDKFLIPLKNLLFGTKLRAAYFVGATIRDDVLWFFRAILICPFASLYGLTECGGCCTHGTPFSGGDCIGMALPGYDLKLIDCPSKNYFVTDAKNGKLAPRGELVLRGIAITPGYFKDKEKTKEMFTKDGWLMTKDVMELDPETGLFRIIDRVNNIKKLSNEEFVASELLEKFYEASPYITQMYIHVDSTKECIVAIAFPDSVVLAEWAKTRNISEPFEKLCDNEELIKTVLADLHERATQKGLNWYEHIVQLKLVPTPFTQSNGCLTYSLKLRRNNIQESFKAEIERLYKRSEHK